MSNPPNPEDRLPAHWTESARETFAAVEEENPSLDASALAGLCEVCELISSADSMQERVNADGLMARGSQGQPVANPLLSEIRLHRTQAAAALRALGLGRARSGASAAGAALAARRHHGGTPGIRAA